MQTLARLVTLLASIACTLVPAAGSERNQLPVAPDHTEVVVPAPRRRVQEPTGAEVEPVVAGRPALPDGALAPLATVRARLAGAPLAEVIHDEPGDGRLWALANAYKASFGVEGATYVPFFGSRAPRNFPVAFRLASVTAGGAPLGFDPAAAPARDGDRIVFDRGPVEERYDLGPDAVEQSFLFEELPAGDLVIEIEVASELERAEDEHGLALEGEHGRVGYSRAVAIDARGRCADAPTRWHAGRIEIRVSAAELATLRPPILIDPVVSTFAVAQFGDDFGRPDCAFDATTGRWVIVYERVFSGSDTDVLVAVCAADGSQLYDRVVDATVAWWSRPAVANNSIADQFLCVAETASSPTGTRTIRARTIDPTVLIPNLGAAFAVSPSGADAHSPDVGGDPSLEAPTYYCVVWQRDTSPSDHDVLARLVTANGTSFGSPIPVATFTGTFDRAPSISATDGAPPASLQEWTIAWQRWISSGDSDLWAARIRWDGVVSGPATALDTSLVNTFFPDVSSPTQDAPRRTLIAYSRGPLSSADTWGILLAGSVVEDVANLTALSRSPANVHHLAPAVDSDGHSFVVVDTETSNEPGGAQTLRISTFADIGGEIAFAETTTLGGFPVQDQAEVSCAGASGGPAVHALAVHRGDSGVASFASDVRAVLYDAGSFATFCEPGLDGVIACPCGNAPGGPGRGCGNSGVTSGARCVASLSSGVVQVHAFDVVPGTLCIVSQGDALLPGGTPFGDGVRCVGGQILRLSNEVANVDGACSFPGTDATTIPQRSAELGAPISAGDVRYYYVYYRDGGPIGCAATFNTTNAARVQW